MFNLNCVAVSNYHMASACHRVLVRYIIHLYCLAVQAGFYSDSGRVRDYRSTCPPFNARLEHGVF